MPPATTWSPSHCVTLPDHGRTALTLRELFGTVHGRAAGERSRVIDASGHVAQPHTLAARCIAVISICSP